VEIYFRGSRVASHARSYRRGGFTTVAEHMPKSHQKHLEWTPSRLIHWASTLGPKTAELVEAILTERRHPEQGYRSCLGILRLERVYGKERLEAACTRAVAVRARSYRHVDSILKNGLDRIPLPDASAPAEPQLPLHENIRGGTYYQ
jgi:transposase